MICKHSVSRYLRVCRLARIQINKALVIMTRAVAEPTFINVFTRMSSITWDWRQELIQFSRDNLHYSESTIDESRWDSILKSYFWFRSVDDWSRSVRSFLDCDFDCPFTMLAVHKAFFHLAKLVENSKRTNKLLSWTKPCRTCSRLPPILRRNY